MQKITIRYKGNIICETVYDPDQNLVTAVWTGYASLESVKEWGEAYLSLMRKDHCPYLLNDDRKSVGSWHDSIEWMESYLVPNLMEEGLRYYAHIVAKNVFGSVSADKLESKIGSTLTMRMFKTREEGFKWIDKIRQSNHIP